MGKSGGADMYSKEELKELKMEFWEGFGLYCSLTPIFRRRKSKFMLYNTKMKGVEMKFNSLYQIRTQVNF